MKFGASLITITAATSNEFLSSGRKKVPMSECRGPQCMEHGPVPIVSHDDIVPPPAAGLPEGITSGLKLDLTKSKAYRVSEPIYHCPNKYGREYTLVDEVCTFSSTVVPSVVCPDGFVADPNAEGICRRTTKPSYDCTEGGDIYINEAGQRVCRYFNEMTPIYSCPKNTQQKDGECLLYKPQPEVDHCYTGKLRDGKCITVHTDAVEYVCPPDYRQEHDTCAKEVMRKTEAKSDKKKREGKDRSLSEIDMFDYEDIELQEFSVLMCGDVPCKELSNNVTLVDDEDEVVSATEPAESNPVYVVDEYLDQCDSQPTSEPKTNKRKDRKGRGRKGDGEIVTENVELEENMKWKTVRVPRTEFVESRKTSKDKTRQPEDKLTLDDLQKKIKVPVVEPKIEHVDLMEKSYTVVTQPAEKICIVGKLVGSVCVVEETAEPTRHCSVSVVDGQCMTIEKRAPIASCPVGDLKCTSALNGYGTTADCTCSEKVEVAAEPFCDYGIMNQVGECVEEADAYPQCPSGFVETGDECYYEDSFPAVCLFSVSYGCVNCGDISE